MKPQMDANSDYFMAFFCAKTMKMFGRFVIAGLFLWAGMMKLIHPGLLFGDILSYRLLPEGVAVGLAWYLPWLEIVLALALLSPRLQEGAWGGLFGLMTVFILALLSAWARGLDITCGCFGSSGLYNQYGWWVTRDALILGVLWWMGKSEERDKISLDIGD